MWWTKAHNGTHKDTMHHIHVCVCDGCASTVYNVHACMHYASWMQSFMYLYMLIYGLLARESPNSVGLGGQESLPQIATAACPWDQGGVLLSATLSIYHGSNLEIWQQLFCDVLHLVWPFSISCVVDWCILVFGTKIVCFCIFNFRFMTRAVTFDSWCR